MSEDKSYKRIVFGNGEITDVRSLGPDDEIEYVVAFDGADSLTGFTPVGYITDWGTFLFDATKERTERWGEAWADVLRLASAAMPDIDDDAAFVDVPRSPGLSADQLYDVLHGASPTDQVLVRTPGGGVWVPTRVYRTEQGTFVIMCAEDMTDG